MLSETNKLGGNSQDLDREFDDVVEKIRKMVSKESEVYEYVVDLEVVRNIMIIRDEIKQALSGSSVVVDFKIECSFAPYAFISIVGKIIPFLDPKLLSWASSLASNVEVYPLLNGSVQMNFTFNSIARRVKKGVM